MFYDPTDQFDLESLIIRKWIFVEMSTLNTISLKYRDLEQKAYYCMLC